MSGPVHIERCESWDEVPGSRERQADSVVRVHLSHLAGGSVDLYLAPDDDPIRATHDDPSEAIIEVLEPEEGDG